MRSGEQLRTFTREDLLKVWITTSQIYTYGLELLRTADLRFVQAEVSPSSKWTCGSHRVNGVMPPDETADLTSVLVS